MIRQLVLSVCCATFLACPAISASTTQNGASISASLPELAKRNNLLMEKIPQNARKKLTDKYPVFFATEHCAGSFSEPTASEHAFTLLTATYPITAVSADSLHIVRVIVSEDRLYQLDWTTSPEFMVADMPETLPGKKLYYGELKCVKPNALSAFLKNFLPNFRKKEAAQTDTNTNDSVCFGFDSVYNSWQCFGYSNKLKTFTRWGYQVGDTD